jgi:hypothetical protein
MRDEVGVLIGLTYLVSNFPPQKDINGTDRFSCFLDLLGREHTV